MHALIVLSVTPATISLHKARTITFVQGIFYVGSCMHHRGWGCGGARVGGGGGSG